MRNNVVSDTSIKKHISNRTTCAQCAIEKRTLCLHPLPGEKPGGEYLSASEEAIAKREFEECLMFYATHDSLPVLETWQGTIDVKAGTWTEKPGMDEVARKKSYVKLTQLDRSGRGEI